MKIRIYALNSINIGDDFELSEEKSHYIKNVLRLKTGDKINIFNERDGEFEGIILVEKKSCLVKPIKFVREDESFRKAKVNLVFANIKNNLVADVLNSCTQIGVDAFFPIITKHTTNAHFSLERGRKIIEEASEQCERIAPPILHPISSFKQLLEKLSPDAFLLFCDEKANFKLNKIKQINAKEFYIFIGPEGGFCEEERELLIEKGTNRVSLGKFILRAETASICASFLTSFLVEI
jgi:16S rRNA (uracil1498-N3)-methyltransferase